jgi:hypothetical protein
MQSKTNKFPVIYALFLAISATVLSLGYSSGSSGDYSGRPGSNGTCANCHSGGTTGGAVTLSGAPTSYNLGQTYPLTLTVTDGDMGAAGFMVAAVNTANNAPLGTFSFSPTAGIRDESNGITHNAKKTPTSGQVQWTFNWVAPSSGNASVRFYFVGNATDNMGSTGNDAVYAGSSASIVVPVEWLTFSAAKGKDNNAFLTWQTAQEQNNAGFEVERSTDGKIFEKIAFVAGRGTSMTKNSYNFTDNTPLSKTSYYRLQQVDFDGTKTASKVISVENAGAQGKLSVYPNPSSGNVVTVNFGDNTLEQVVQIAQISVFNALGQLVLQQKTTGQQQVQLDISDLAKGTYFVQKAGTTEGVRFVKN